MESQTDQPDRRIYTITIAGQAELRQWLAQPEVELSPKKETTILKLFFSAQLDREIILTQLRVQRDLHHQQMDYYRNVTLQIIQRAAAEFPGLGKDALLSRA